MTQAEYKAVLARYLPQAAVDAVYDFIVENNVYMRITRERRSKLGDYRWPTPQHNYHEITVNGDLNPYLFLLVLLHEAGHLDCRLRHGGTVQPHGHEWQQCYLQRIAQFVGLGAFPADVVPLLERYCRTMPLNRRMGTEIENRLHRYDPGYVEQENITLNELQPGDCFRIVKRPAICFRAVARQRTRWKCQDTATGLFYLVAGNAVVEPVD